jgi:hypothetical protein
MKMASFYEGLYQQSAKRNEELNFRLGYIQESLARLGRLVESGNVKADNYYIEQLNLIVKASELSKKSFDEWQAEQKAKEATL